VSGEARDVLVPPGTIGYLDAISAVPGATVNLHVSSTAPTWRAELVRLYALEIPGFGVERRADPVPSFAAIEREGIEQTTAIGSYGRAEPLGLDQFDAPLTLSVTICPTRPGAGPQAALAQRDEAGVAGWSLGLDAEGRPHLWCATDGGDGDRATEAGESGATADGELDRATEGDDGDHATEVAALGLTTPVPLKPGCWYRLTATIDAPAAKATLAVDPVGTFTSNRLATGRGSAHRVEAALPGVPQPATAPLLLAAAALDPNGQPLEGFDGKIERPSIHGAAPTTAVGGDPGRTSPQFVREGSPPDAATENRTLAHWDPRGQHHPLRHRPPLAYRRHLSRRPSLHPDQPPDPSRHRLHLGRPGR